VGKSKEDVHWDGVEYCTCVYQELYTFCHLLYPSGYDR
jgi:hypothetical protein